MHRPAYQRRRLLRATTRRIQFFLSLGPWSRRRKRVVLSSGTVERPLPGWASLEVRGGRGFSLLPRYRNCGAVRAEHLLEHLTLEEGIEFLLDTRLALAPRGALRLSTPDLEAFLPPDAESSGAALGLNAAFYGDRRDFLWSQHLLEEALLACGFDDVQWSEEAHQLVAEARRGALDRQRLRMFRDLAWREFNLHVETS
jgi:hypothetical protein